MGRNLQQHIDKATHNAGLHYVLKSQFPDDYFDWKCVVLHYIALHYLKALAARDGKDIGETHAQNVYNITSLPEGKPYKYDGPPTMPLKGYVSKEYIKLKNYSENARYNGIKNIIEYREETKKNYIESLKSLDAITKYMESRGLPII